MREFSTIGAVAVLISVGLPACVGTRGQDDEDGDSSNGGDGDSKNPTMMGDGDVPVDEDGDGIPDDPEVCVPGTPPTSQIPRLLNREYDAAVQDLLGITTLASTGSPPSTLLVPDYEGSLTDIAWNSYLVAAQDIAAEVMEGDRGRFMSCDPAAAGCLMETIRTFGRKAFRRPLTDTEVASFERLDNLQPAGTPEEVAEAILFAFLASPSFILKPELAQEPAGDGFALSQHEIAARLSFALWGSVPDDVLNAAADAGELATREQVFAQAQRMIALHDRVAPIVREFHRHYAHIKNGSHWASLQHDPAAFPDYTNAAVEPMMAEIDAFFQTVTFENGTFSDLLLSDLGFVNQDTAALYGLNPAAYGPELARTEFAPGTRPGFLTRVGFLSSYSGYAMTSPILRGAFITERVLGIEIESPPPGATDTPVPEGNYTTQRQRMEALTEPLPCGSCHTPYINPPGFVLEAFDAVGAAQVTDALGGPIDGTAEVFFTEDESQTINDPLSLMQGIANTPTARRRYAEAWVSFATKRNPNSNDACVVEQLSMNLSDDGYPILSLLIDLTLADSFHVRAVGN